MSLNGFRSRSRVAKRVEKMREERKGKEGRTTAGYQHWRCLGGLLVIEEFVVANVGSLISSGRNDTSTRYGTLHILHKNKIDDTKHRIY
jgi:hypothetical protein